MAILKQKLNRKNDSGTYDEIHLKTDASNVSMSTTDETLLSAKISSMDTAIAGKQPAGSYAAANHNHNGVYQPVGNYQPAGSYATANHSHNGANLSFDSTRSINDVINSNYSMIINVNNEVNNLKTSVSNGKSAVASAITDKGVSTSATASFNTMASNIRNINQGLTIQYIGELYTSSMPSIALDKTYSISGYLTARTIYLDSGKIYTSPFTKFISMHVHSPYWNNIMLTLESGETIYYFSGGFAHAKFNANYNCYLLITSGMTSTIKNELATIGFDLYEIYFN